MLKETLSTTADKLNFFTMYPINKLKEIQHTDPLKQKLMCVKKDISKILISESKGYLPIHIDEEFVNAIPLKLRSNRTDINIRNRGCSGYYSSRSKNIILDIDDIANAGQIIVHESLHRICNLVRKKTIPPTYKSLDILNKYRSEFIDIDEGITQYFTLEMLDKIGIKSKSIGYDSQVGNVEKLVNVMGYDYVKSMYFKQDYFDLQSTISMNLGKDRWKSFSSNFKYNSSYSPIDKILWQLAIKKELYLNKADSKIDIESMLEKTDFNDISSHALSDLLTIKNPAAKQFDNISSLTAQQIKLSDQEYIIAIHNNNDNKLDFYSASSKDNTTSICHLEYNKVNIKENENPNKYLNKICELINNNENTTSCILSLSSNLYISVTGNDLVAAYKDSNKPRYNFTNDKHINIGQPKIERLDITKPISFKDYHAQKSTYHAQDSEPKQPTKQQDKDSCLSR